MNKVKRIDKLTKEQEAMFPAWVKKWTDIGLKTGAMDDEAFAGAVKVAYEKAGITFPNKIIKVSSPLVGAFASSIASERLNGGAVGDAVGDAVRGAVGGAVDGAVDDAVRVAVDGAVGGAVDDAVRVAVNGAVGGAVDDAVDGAVGVAVNGAVRGAVDDAVGVAVDGAVGGAVDDAVRGAKIKWHEWMGNQFWVGGWWGSPSYVSFMTDVCGLELDEDIQERADAYRTMCESACYSWLNNSFVMVSERPIRIVRNEAGLLHWDHGKAIEWPDGWGLYMIHGVRFEEEEYWKIINGDFTMADMATIGSAEKATAAMQMLTPEKLIEGFDAKLVAVGKKYDYLKETYGEDWCRENMPFVFNEPTKLYAVEDFTGKAERTGKKTGDTEYCMIMQHPTVKKAKYLQWVHPNIGRQHDADLAQAESRAMPKEDYMIAVEA